MAIFTRKEEIEIMKLVGATKWFIRGPFIFEAALYGIVAAVIAVIVSYALLLGTGPKLGSYIDVKSTIDFFRSYPALIVFGELIIGIFIGAFSSLLAMSRYLKL
jgi:cell division transport system permease protein